MKEPRRREPAPPRPLPPFVSPAAGGTRLRVHAVPRASSTGPAGMQGQALKVRVQAPPEDGRANEALREWAAEALGAAKRDVSLVSGASSREKVFFVRGVAPEDAAAALAPAGAEGEAN